MQILPSDIWLSEPCLSPVNQSPASIPPTLVRLTTGGGQLHVEDRFVMESPVVHLELDELYELNDLAYF